MHPVRYSSAERLDSPSPSEILGASKMYDGERMKQMSAESAFGGDTLPSAEQLAEPTSTTSELLAEPTRTYDPRRPSGLATRRSRKSQSVQTMSPGSELGITSDIASADNSPQDGDVNAAQSPPQQAAPATAPLAAQARKVSSQLSGSDLTLSIHVKFRLLPAIALLSQDPITEATIKKAENHIASAINLITRSEAKQNPKLIRALVGRCNFYRAACLNLKSSLDGKDHGAADYFREAAEGAKGVFEEAIWAERWLKERAKEGEEMSPTANARPTSSSSSVGKWENVPSGTRGKEAKVVPLEMLNAIPENESKLEKVSPTESSLDGVNRPAVPGRIPSFSTLRTGDDEEDAEEHIPNSVVGGHVRIADLKSPTTSPKLPPPPKNGAHRSTNGSPTTPSRPASHSGQPLTPPGAPSGPLSPLGPLRHSPTYSPTRQKRNSLLPMSTQDTLVELPQSASSPTASLKGLFARRRSSMAEGLAAIKTEREADEQLERLAEAEEGLSPWKEAF